MRGVRRLVFFSVRFVFLGFLDGFSLYVDEFV